MISIAIIKKTPNEEKGHFSRLSQQALVVFPLGMGLKMFFCCLLCLVRGWVLWACTLKNFTLLVERQECGHCMAINTTICSGLCYTQDTNVRGFVGKRFLIQRGCMHRAEDYHTAEMPGCPVHIDPLFSYPIALHCHCTKCNTTRAECIQKSKKTSNMCSKESKLPH